MGIREAVKRAPVVGELIERTYMRMFRGDGRVLTITGGYLKGWQLRCVVRSVTPDHLSGDCESFLQRVIVSELTPGAVFYDVGANVGYMSLVAARFLNGSGRVVAYEAHPRTAADARRQLGLNGVKNAVVVSAAMSDKAGYADIDVDGSSDMVRLASLSHSTPRQTLRVPTVTLDDEVAKRGAPDVIKMDIEGAELLALQGATRLLREHAPTLIMEIHSEELSQEIYPLLGSLGYRFYRVSGTEIVDGGYVRFVIARKG